MGMRDELWTLPVLLVTLGFIAGFVTALLVVDPVKENVDRAMAQIEAIHER